MKNSNKIVAFLANNGIYTVLALIIIYFSITASSFLTFGNLVQIPYQVNHVVFIAVGMTLVIITGGIDLSVGCVVGLTAIVFAIFVENKHMAIPLAIMLSIVIGSMCGVSNGIFVTRFKVPPFIATLAMWAIARGVARYVSGNTKISISTEALAPYTTFVNVSSIFGIPLLVILMLVVVVIFGLILIKTRFGRYVLATGGNEEAARLSGINVKSVKLKVYIITAALSALVGVIQACSFTNGDPELGKMWELDAIAACVVGGTSLMGGKGNIFKTLLGAILIGILNNGLGLKGMSQEIIYIIKGAIILAAVIMDQLNTK